MADNDNIVQWADTDFIINFKQLNEFLNKTSYEAVSIMVFFQVVAVAFIIGRFSTLYLLMWISLTFLIYSVAGPFFCMKWMLVVSSLVWHFLLFLWTHPYLIACLILAYGINRVITIWSHHVHEDENVMHMTLTLQKLQSIEEKSTLMQQQIDELSTNISTLLEQSNSESVIQDWVSDIQYPLDRRREAAKSLQNTPSRSQRK